MGSLYKLATTEPAAPTIWLGPLRPSGSRQLAAHEWRLQGLVGTRLPLSPGWSAGASR